MPSRSIKVAFRERIDRNDSEFELTVKATVCREQFGSYVEIDSIIDEHGVDRAKDLNREETMWLEARAYEEAIDSAACNAIDNAYASKEWRAA